MRILVKYIFVFSFLAALLVLPMPISAAGQKTVIISNQADLPAANYIKQILSSAGADVTISSASGFESVKKSAEVTVIIVLGGPDAYEGVGQISAKYLSSDDQQYLRSVKGSSVVRKFSDSGKEIIIIAGNTRSETKLSSEVYSQSGFPGSSLAVLAPNIVGRTGERLTYRMVMTDKKGGTTQTAMATVEKFSGTVNGTSASGMKWTYAMSYQGQNVQVEQISAYTGDGRTCTMVRYSVEGNVVFSYPWTCVQESQVSTPAGGGSSSDILYQRITTEIKTVPAGTFLCLKYEIKMKEGAISRIWSSSQVPLTGLVAVEYEGTSSSVVIELVRIG